MTDHREQAIRDVAEAFMLSTSYINDCLVKPYTCDDDRIAYAVAQRERVRELEAQSRWISVKDRLPSADQKVLAWDGDSVELAWYHPDSVSYRWDCDTYGLSPDDVTHWRSLDAPPVEAQLQQKEGERG